MNKQVLTSLFVVCSFGILNAQQDLPTPDSLLQWIASQQKNGDAFYDDGLFASQRLHKKNVYEDNSLFFSTLIALTLHSIAKETPSESQENIQSIYQGVRKNAFRYRSRRGRATFNYWQTDPDIPHPNAPAKYQTDKYKVPDDFDDTSMIAVLLDSPEFAQEIRQEMVRYTATRKKKVKTTFNRLKRSEAYGVWYADKWKQEFDICALTNTLLFVLRYGYELNRYDSASFSLIQESIMDELHQKHPFVLSPYYNKTPVILYHVSRLMAMNPPGFLAELKSAIISELHSELKSTEFELHKIILYTSLLRLGETPVPIIDVKKLLEEQEEFHWFSANIMLAAGSGTFLRKTLNDSKLVPTLYWRCDPYYWTLVLEFLVLRDATLKAPGS